MMSVKQKQYGFTLIEIMIVVAIVAIIAAFAYPSYVEQVRKSKRSDAQIGLQQIAQRQEAYFSRTFSYASTLSQLNYTADTIDSPEGQYVQTIATVTPATCNGTRTNACTAFVVRAQPKTGTSQAHDKTCATFTLNNLGRKQAFNNAATPVDTTKDCW
ncbi:MAG: pilus assembly protein PilE [Thiothrix nivea]|nr:MAG: pilus assembly protein PilE [Thiothrix nivea]